jgi:deoxycytidylate deaminase
MNGDIRTSLVFALVAATGSPLREFIEVLSGLLRKYGPCGRRSLLAGLHRSKRDIFERTQPTMTTDPAAYEAFLKALDGSLLLDITEYGRPVHAEMEAVLSCVRNGILTRGARLYCTTFPCHNCAKHLVDAGIHEVQYVEAYPKSMDLFSLTLSSGRRVKRKNKSGEIAAWDPLSAEPRVPSYLGSVELEHIAIAELRTAMERQP